MDDSVDLESWESTEGLIEERVVEVEPGTEQVEAVYLVPVDQAPQRFLRLRVLPLAVQQ